MGAIAALVMSLFVVAMLFGAVVATVMQNRNTSRPATPGAASDSQKNDRLAA
jgi:hypothetical protein